MYRIFKIRILLSFIITLDRFFRRIIRTRIYCITGQMEISLVHSSLLEIKEGSRWHVEKPTESP